VDYLSKNMDSLLNVIGKYAFILTFVLEVYLIFTNVSYVFLKGKYFVPLLPKSQKLKCYRGVAYLSRTLYLVVITIYNSAEFAWPIFETGWGKCVYLKLVPIIYLFISVLCRTVFLWTRSVVIKNVINLSHMWDAIIFLLNSCFCLGMFTWWLLQFDAGYYCYTKWGEVPTVTVIICTVSYVVFEVLSFLLYYMPLKNNDSYLDRSSIEYRKAFLTENQHLDDMETGQDWMEDDHRAVLPESYSDGIFTTRIQMSQNDLSLVTKFRKSVVRNLRAGVLTTIVGTFQYALYFLYLGDIIYDNVYIMDEKMNFQDEFVRMIVIILGLTQYACMMYTENHWQRAFIPFCCWQWKSWTY